MFRPQDIYMTKTLKIKRFLFTFPFTFINENMFTFPFTCKHFSRHPTDNEHKNSIFITDNNKELIKFESVIL